MHIVEINCGLGNQMFQYALYLKLRSIYGNSAKIDISFYDRVDSHNGYELDKIFSTTADIATPEEVYFAGCKNRLYREANVFKRFLFKIKYKPGKVSRGNALDANEYFEDIFRPNISYYSGWWQNEKYFIDIADEVRQEFTFKELDSMNMQFARDLTETESVSIHVRRGDYLDSANSHFHGICNDVYYNNAISYVKKKCDNPVFYVFSNDIDWCKENLHLNNVVYVDWNTGKESYKDMQLMSLCKHNIIANSSFSWWSAWLNDNPNKIVCAPCKWINIKESVDGECPKDWERILID